MCDQLRPDRLPHHCVVNSTNSRQLHGALRRGPWLSLFQHPLIAWACWLCLGRHLHMEPASHSHTTCPGCRRRPCCAGHGLRAGEWAAKVPGRWYGERGEVGREGTWPLHLC
jgi:hypothetical protein